MSALSSIKTDDASILEGDSFLDVDLIEVDDLLNSASRLLEEVYSTRPMRAPESVQAVLSPREDAMQQVQKFLSSIRDNEEEEDVVFVEARPGNAPPANARTTAVVDLCTPSTADEATPNPRNSRGRPRRRTDDIVPIAFPTLAVTPNASSAPTKSRRGRAKKGTSVDVKPSIVHITSPDTSAANVASTTRSPPGGGAPSLICAVCMESVLNRQPTSTSCGHIFCRACIMQAIRLTKKCPLCNSKLKPNQVHRVYF